MYPVKSTQWTSAIQVLELDESQSEEVEEVSTTVTQAQLGKTEENIVIQDVDYSVEVLDPSVEDLEKSIDKVVIGESAPAKAKAVEDKMDTSKIRADDSLRKRKSFDKEDLLEEMEEVEGSSPVKKLREKSGSKIPPCSQ